MKFNLKKILLPATGVATIFGIATLIKDGVGGAWYHGEEEIFGKTVLITGTNTGLGKQLAHEMANRGGRIIMGCRDMKACAEVRDKIIEDTYNKSVYCKKLDLASLDSIRRFAEDINKNEERVDILINNAAVMMPQEKELTEDGFELQFGVNYLGPFLLTNLLLEKVKSSQPSRILNITCHGFQRGRIDFHDLNFDIYYKPKHAYDRSKQALFLFTESLAEKLKDTDVAVYNVNPGMCKTELQRHLGWYNSYISKYIFVPFYVMMTKDPIRGIQTMLHCALSPDIQKESGGLFSECEFVDTFERGRLDTVNKTRLWVTSEIWTRLRDVPEKTTTTKDR